MGQYLQFDSEAYAIVIDGGFDGYTEIVFTDEARSVDYVAHFEIDRPSHASENSGTLFSGDLLPGEYTLTATASGFSSSPGRDGVLSIANLSFVLAPEPSTALLLGMGFAVIGVLRRQRFR